MWFQAVTSGTYTSPVREYYIGDPQPWTGTTGTPYYQRPQPAAVGWICPKCGAGVAAWASRCGCNGYQQILSGLPWETPCTSSIPDDIDDVTLARLGAQHWAESLPPYDDMGNE